jgi:hypothetical protein
MLPLAHLLTQYPILSTLSTHLSAIDLFNLALTSTTHYDQILSSPTVFRTLTRQALCPGTGLLARQNLAGPYTIHQRSYIWGPTGRRAHYDEEIEVRLYNTKCDAANALPCLKCNVNVCEECRYVPRVRDTATYASSRRPHLDAAYQSHTILCYCNDCDAEVEKGVVAKGYLSEVCDCDAYKRWICLKCKGKEWEEDGWYYTNWTRGDWEQNSKTQPGGTTEGYYDGMVLGDHQHYRAVSNPLIILDFVANMIQFWCPCGKRSPSDGNIRCQWCKRRHRMSKQDDEGIRRTYLSYDENPSYIPFFDDVSDEWNP